jgi:hypothetical protein
MGHPQTDPVVVTGMHRSGTSFLVRALNLLGLWLGSERHLYTVEGRAGIGNPKGNYEHTGSVAINDAILANSGGTWHNPPRHLTAPANVLDNIRQLADYLESSMPPGYLRWGWKDPRTVLTLDVWAKTLNRKTNLIVTFRHPRAVAESLHSRDGMPLERGYALWGFYNRCLLRHLDQQPAITVRFDVE